MPPRPRRVRHGFTMVEMLMVVSLIAIISSVAIVLYNGATKDAAETVSAATQRQLTNQVNTFYNLHGNKLCDGFDSLLGVRSSTFASTTWSTVAGLQIANDPRVLFYVGYDRLDNATLAATPDYLPDPNAKSQGLDTRGGAWGYMGAFRNLTAAQLTTSDVTNLNALGIYTVYDIACDADLFHANEPNRVKRTLKAGDPICIIDPMTARTGIGTYADLGTTISDTALYPVHDATSAAAAGGTTTYPVSSGDLNATGRSAALTKVKFIVLGIGTNTGLVGDRRGGLADVPMSSIVPAGCYNKYLLVVKVPGGTFSPMDVSTSIAGVLDPVGATPRMSRMWATRTE